MMLPNMAMLELRKHGSLTLQELASKTGLPWNAVSANMGGLHDYGIVTKYGSRPDSVVRFDENAEQVPWVQQQVEKARQMGVLP